jgi:branched-chain amino acid transport system permease protein
VTGADLDISEYSFLIYGVAIVTFMLFRPEGLLPSARRRHEFHEEEELEELIEAQPI